MFDIEHNHDKLDKIEILLLVSVWLLVIFKMLKTFPSILDPIHKLLGF